MRLPKPVDFHEDETFLSLIIRLTGANSLLGSWRLIARYGLTEMPRNPLPVGHLSIISDISGVPADKLMEPINALNGKLSAHESELSDPVNVVNGYTLGMEVRFCPSCMAEKPYLRTRWTFTFTDVCSIHRTRLTSYCACGKYISWDRKRLLCTCGLELSKAPADRLPDAEVDGPAFLEALVTGKRSNIPPLLVGQDLHGLIRVLIATANLFPMRVREEILDDPADPGGLIRFGAPETTYRFRYKGAAWNRSLSLGLAVLSEDPAKVENALKMWAHGIQPRSADPIINKLYDLEPGGAYGEMLSRVFEGLHHRPWLRRPGPRTGNGPLHRERLGRPWRSFKA